MTKNLLLNIQYNTLQMVIHIQLWSELLAPLVNMIKDGNKMKLILSLKVEFIK